MDRSERASLTAVPALSELTHTLREAIGRELAGIAQPPPSVEEAESTDAHHDRSVANYFVPALLIFDVYVLHMGNVQP